MPVDVALAVVQMQPAPGDVEANLAKARDLATEAADEGAGLLVLPELFATGYGVHQVARLAEPPGGRVERALEALAKELDMVLVAAVAERTPDGAATAAVTVGRDGLLQRRWKRRLWRDERAALRPGGAPAAAATPAGPVGALVCYEVEFPEDARAAALAGAEVLAVPAAFTTPRLWDLATRARAVENGVFLAAANQAYPFCGGSRIVAPDGQVLASVTGREGVAVARAAGASYATWRAEHPYLADLAP